MAGFPSVLFQIVGDGGKNIFGIRPDIAVPITIAVHGVVFKAGGHKLTLPHGPCPRSNKRIQTNMPLIQNFQGGQQFGFKKIAAASLERQGGQGFHHRKPARNHPIMRFHTPQGHHDFRRHTVFFGYAFQQILIIPQAGGACAHALFGHHAVNVFGKSHFFFGLLLIQRDDAIVGGVDGVQGAVQGGL